jgi:hypothetical protein
MENDRRLLAAAIFALAAAYFLTNLHKAIPQPDRGERMHRAKLCRRPRSDNFHVRRVRVGMPNRQLRCLWRYSIRRRPSPCET